MLNKALWRKTITDARLLLAFLTVLLFVFNWLFVYLSSLIELGPLAVFLQTLPPAFEKLAGVPFASVATPVGRISSAYVDPVVIIATSVWAIGRGSDAVSGEIGRGTMEMLVAQPVHRLSILATQGVVTTLGSAILTVAIISGTAMGLATVPLSEPVSWTWFIPGALNLFATMFFLSGVSTLLSSADNHRWRTIGLMGAFYVLQLVCEAIGRLVSWLEWLMYCTFFTACEPQALVIDAENAWTLSWRYDSTLIGLGLASYVIAAAIFAHRDLPAPL